MPKLQCRFTHEINNSLAVIAGHADLLSDYFPRNARITVHVESIRQALRQAAKLVHECECVLVYADYLEKKKPSSSEAQPRLEQSKELSAPCD